MFYKIVWQHVQDVAGVLITTLLQIYLGTFSEKNWKSVRILQNYGQEFVASLLAHPSVLADSAINLS